MLGWLVRALMSDPTRNDPAVPRRVKLFVLITIIWFLGANARSSYAIDPQPTIGGLRLGILASFDEPIFRAPSQSKELSAPEVSRPTLPFPALKLPIPAGSGHLPRDGGYNNGFLHLRGDYDQFALDMCEGSKCSRNGRHVIAPTDITFDFSSPYALGYHFFEVYDDGREKLCMSLGHFDWPLSLFPSGAPEPGIVCPQGAVLGDLSWWGGMPHVHIGIWTMASTTPSGIPVRCHQWTVPRVPQPFTGQYQLDGVDYPACWPFDYSCYNVHAGRVVESSNAAYSYTHFERPSDFAGMFVEKEEVEEVDRRITPTKTGDFVSAFQ